MVIGAVIFFGSWDWQPMTKEDLRKATEELRAQNQNARSFEDIYKQGQEAERARQLEQK